MFKKILHFIQYHNFANLALVALFVVSAGTAFAATDEGVRQAVADVVIKETQTIVQIDNNILVNTNLEDFDAELQILGVEEDDYAYYVDYQFNTLALDDGYWQETTKKDKITIDKEVLAGGDLGLFLAEELGELTTQELRFLKEAQIAERKKGAKKKKVATEYSGLIGKLLDTKEETFDGYDRVIEEPEKQEEQIVAEPTQPQNVIQEDTKQVENDEVQKTVEEDTAPETELTPEEGQVEETDDLISNTIENTTDEAGTETQASEPVPATVEEEPNDGTTEDVQATDLENAESEAEIKEDDNLPDDSTESTDAPEVVVESETVDEGNQDAVDANEEISTTE